MDSLLIFYLFAAMTSWVPVSAQVGHGELVAAASARYHRIAESVADVAYDPDEEPLYASRAETALILLGIASYASEFARTVSDAVEGEFGLWKVRAERGILLTREGFRVVPFDSDEWAANAAHGPEIDQSVELAARVELHVVRHWLSTIHHLGPLTGEGTNGPIARAWLVRGRAYFVRHPYSE